MRENALMLCMLLIAGATLWAAASDALSQIDQRGRTELPCMAIRRAPRRPRETEIHEALPPFVVVCVGGQ